MTGEAGLVGAAEATKVPNRMTAQAVSFMREHLAYIGPGPIDPGPAIGGAFG